ncbi:MAG: EamA family transporter, partial [Candidatus Kariarchaeaceae archaeon]
MVQDYVLYASVSIILFAFTSVITKFIIPEIGGPFRFLSVQLTLGVTVTSSILLGLVLGGYTINIHNTPDILLKLILSTIFAFAGYTTLMIGFRKGNASVGGVILSSRVIVTIPLAFFALKEQYEADIYIYIIVALLGAILVSWDPKLTFREFILFKGGGARWFFITMFFWALANFYTTSIGEAIPAIVFIAYRQILFIPLVLILYKPGIEWFDQEKKPITLKVIKKLVIYILFLISAQILFVSALQKSLTISEGIGVLEGATTFILSLGIAKFYDNSVMDEPLDQKTIFIRIL